MQACARCMYCRKKKTSIKSCLIIACTLYLASLRLLKPASGLTTLTSKYNTDRRSQLIAPPMLYVVYTNNSRTFW